MKVLVSFSKKGEVIPRVVGSFKILKNIGKVVYAVKSPPSCSQFVRYFVY